MKFTQVELFSFFKSEHFLRVNIYHALTIYYLKYQAIPFVSCVLWDKEAYEKPINLQRI